MSVTPGVPQTVRDTLNNILNRLTSIDVAVGGGTAFNQYGQDTSVVTTTDTQLVSYTVPAGQTANIAGFSGTGGATGRFTLKIDGTAKAVIRTSAAKRSETAYFGGGVISAAAGEEITVTGYHEETPNQTLEANVFGTLA